MWKIDSDILELATLFAKNTFEISLVGGSVRDMFLGVPTDDLDLTTSARPDDIIKIIKHWGDELWLAGKKFGTVATIKNGKKIEITTYRSDAYSPETRKPIVAFGNSLTDDLKRRDFTINAIALKLDNPSAPELIDPYDGVNDIQNKIIKTPSAPEISFSDDPLRMLRAFRFASTLNFDIDLATTKAINQMANRIEIVSKERIAAEFSKLMLGKNPVKAIDEMVYTGLAEYIIPEVEALKINTHNKHKDIYEHSLNVLQQGIKLEPNYFTEPNLTLRLALLLHDIGKVKTRKIHSNGTVSFLHHDVVGTKMSYKLLTRLKFDKETAKNVAKLVELHLRFYGYADSEWTDSAVRRYIIDAGPLINQLHVLTKADNTSKNEKKLKRLQFAYEDLEKRIIEVLEKEELSKIRPELDGQEIMQILNLKPGPEVGKAYKFLLNYRIEHGEVGKDKAKQALLKEFS